MKTSFNQERLNEVCQWFNSLDKTQQMNIMEWVTDKEENLSLPTEDFDNFNFLIKTIIALIVKTNDNKQKIEDILVAAGLDKIVIEALVEFCRPHAIPYFDAKIVSSLKKSNLKKTITFVINHVILCNDYQDHSKSEFITLTGLKEQDAYRVFAFLKHHYEAVARRQISIESLSNILLHKFNIRSESVKEIISPILENHANMSISMLFRELDSIKESIDKLSDYFHSRV